MSNTYCFIANYNCILIWRYIWQIEINYGVHNNHWRKLSVATSLFYAVVDFSSSSSCDAYLREVKTYIHNR
jgi:hypothetical protein